jgi:hypothetical protein
MGQTDVAASCIYADDATHYPSHPMACGDGLHPHLAQQMAMQGNFTKNSKYGISP